MKKFIIITLAVIIVILLVVATIGSVTTGRSLDECSLESVVAFYT